MVRSGKKSGKKLPVMVRLKPVLAWNKLVRDICNHVICMWGENTFSSLFTIHYKS